MVIGVCRPIEQINRRHFYFTQTGRLKDFSAQGCYESRAGAPFNGVPNPQSGWVYGSNPWAPPSPKSCADSKGGVPCLLLSYQPPTCEILFLGRITFGTGWVRELLLLHIPRRRLFSGHIGGSDRSRRDNIDWGFLRRVGYLHLLADPSNDRFLNLLAGVPQLFNNHELRGRRMTHRILPRCLCR